MELYARTKCCLHAMDSSVFTPQYNMSFTDMLCLFMLLLYVHYCVDGNIVNLTITVKG